MGTNSTGCTGWERDFDDETEQPKCNQLQNTKESVMEPMLQFFQYAHLPPMMQIISKPFGELAELMVATLPRNPERTVMLRKLLEAKDCAVRAMIYVGAN